MLVALVPQCLIFLLECNNNMLKGIQWRSYHFLRTPAVFQYLSRLNTVKVR